MKVLIAASLLVALNSVSLASDKSSFVTIGDMRSACKAYVSEDPNVGEARKGVCHGWLVSEVRWRYGACLLWPI